MRLLCFALLAGFAMGCGGSASRSVGADIGSSGGTLRLDGLTLTIPPSALASTVHVQVTSSESGIPSGYSAGSPLYRVMPTGLALLAPAALTIVPANAVGDDTIFWADADGVFAALPTTRSGGSLAASIDLLSSGFAAEPLTAGADLGAAADLTASGGDLAAADLAPSPPGADLAGASDLSSAPPSADLLAAPDGGSCSDGVKDNGETDIDCGGPVCFPCKNGKGCATNNDCASFTCVASVCVAPIPPSCSNGVQDGTETAIDCGGGTCPKCANGLSCLVASDCTSGLCTGSPLVCTAAPSCTDGVKDQDETDIDCGGKTCPACPVNGACIFDSDCASQYCDTAGLPTSVGACATKTCAPNFVTSGSITGTPVAVADFDGDHKLDLLIADAYSFSIAFGNGDGTFGAPTDASAVATGAGYDVVDFDGNGVPDIFIYWAGSFQALIGAGDGTFRRSTAVTTTTGALQTIAGEFTGDGYADVVIAYNGTPVTGYLLYPGVGDGTFGAPLATDLDAEAATQGMTAMVKQRGHGHDAFAYITHGVGGHVVTTMNESRCGPPESLISGPNTILSGADLDGDGLDDVVVDLPLSPGPGGPYAGDVSFGAFVVTPTACSDASEYGTADGTAVVLGDFNGDGKGDLVVSGNRLMCGNGDGRLQSPVAFTGGSTIQGDFDGDGKNDYIANGVVYLNRN